MPGAPRRRARGEPGRCTRGDAKGSEVSLGSLGQDHLVQGKIGDRLAQPLLLLLKLLQPLELSPGHAAVKLAPAIIGKLRLADMTNRFRRRYALPLQNLDLLHLRNDILGLLSFASHVLVVLIT